MCEGGEDGGVVTPEQQAERFSIGGLGFEGRFGAFWQVMPNLWRNR